MVAKEELLKVESCSEDVITKNEIKDEIKETNNLKEEAEETKNIKEETKDINEKIKDINEETKDINEETKDINKETKDINKEMKDINEEIELNCKQETVTENQETEEQLMNENLPKVEFVSQESQIEKIINKNVNADLEVPDTMEIIQVTEVTSPILVDKPIIEDSKPSSPLTTQEIPYEIKPKSPSPVSTMTCSIDGNTDTEWNIPVAPAMGTIKINISQKIAPVNKSPTIPTENTSVEPQSPQDLTPTFGEIDPDQPPPPGLEMETVVVPKIQREMKQRLMNNTKKLTEYPIVNKGKEMSGLCSIM